MGHYKSNVRDLEFNLFEVLGIGECLDDGTFGELDTAAVRAMLGEISVLAEGSLGASWADTDRHPPSFDPETHSVTLPESFKSSYRALRDIGWETFGVTNELGGIEVPRIVYWAMSEMILGAQPAAFIYAVGSSAASLFYDGYPEEHRQRIRIAVEQGWGGTMVLTEPDAGSDVGAGRTRAIAQPDGSWHLAGVKRFISSADSGDLFPNILHLVLARPEGPGIRGLSLFYVPKFHFDPITGALGERNGVFVTNLEHKMGLRASVTCELTFGGHDIPAVGWLIGELGDGIAQMFKVIENARMMVGTKAIATLSTGYLNALDYAKERVQGADLTRMADKTAPKVRIIEHPDVRRSLMTQKAYAEGLRAVFLYTAAHQDEAVARHVLGIAPELAARVNDLLLPIVKGVGSERAYQYLTESLQTLGGSGFLQDYPIEQYIRDAKIDSLYEGTTAIQAQDFFFRKIARDHGVALAHVAGQVQQFIESETGNGQLAGEHKLLATALEDVQAMAAALTEHLIAAQEQPSELYKVGLGSVRFLLAVGDLLIGWHLLRQSKVAEAALRAGVAKGSERAFYLGKIGVARFFAHNILPGLTATRAILSNLDNDIMQIPEASF